MVSRSGLLWVTVRSGRRRLFACSVGDRSPVPSRAGGHPGHAERNALKVTVDSSEPLEDAIRVVGALYGVRLRLVEDGQETSKPTHQATTKPRSGRRAGSRGPEQA